MKFLSKLASLVLLCGAMLTLQAGDRMFAVIDYMHIPEDGNEAEYIELEKLWQRLHQKNVDSGRMAGWYLYKVENGGRGHYVTANIFTSLDKMAELFAEFASGTNLEGLYSPKEKEKMDKTESRRDWIRSELWALEAMAASNNPITPATRAYVHFMKSKPGKSAAYHDMEKNLFSKIHQARIDAGQMRGWYFVSRMFPSGLDAEYDYVTINLFDKQPTWDQKVAESALSASEAAKMPGNLMEMRTTVREEIWTPLLRTQPKK